MLRLGLVLLFLGLGCLAHAQFNSFPPGTFQSRAPLDASGFTPACTESSNFLARTSGLDTTHKTNYDNLICGLVTDGLCCAASGGVLDALYVFATADTTTAKLNLTQNAFNLTQTGSLTFSADHGYTGDASTGFFDTGFNPSTAGGNFARDSATLVCYSLTSRTTPQLWVMIGNFNASFNVLEGASGAGPGGFLYAVTDAGVNFVAGETNAQGSWLSSRTTSTLTTLYKNNSGSIGTSADASSALDNLKLFLFALNSGGSAANFSGDQMSACGFGAKMTGTQAANMQSRLNTYMTAYGINVY